MARAESNSFELCRTCHRSKIVGGGRERLVVHQRREVRHELGSRARRHQPRQGEMRSIHQEQDDRERAFVLEYLNAHGSRQYKMDDVLRQEVWQQNQSSDWNHCYVHEITLVE